MLSSRSQEDSRLLSQTSMAEDMAEAANGGSVAAAGVELQEEFRSF